MHTILSLIYSGTEVSDLRSQIADLFSLTDRASFVIGDGIINTFGGVAVGTAGVAGLDTIALWPLARE